uniref:Hydrolase n=1 Tax=Meloidogyne incognita TaxID=6306 RepID=A0A914NBY8_MELIC
MEDTEDVREITIEPEGLSALLGIPLGARSIVIFAHGSGSGRLSPRNNYVAAELRRAGMATLLLDLLRPEEEAIRQNVFDIPLLASRLNRASEWVHSNVETETLTQGYFGARDRKF